MGFFSSDSHQEVYNQEPREGKWSHELIGGAAAFEAMRQYEKHEEREGKPQSHAFAKELIAGFAGAEADKLFETKGLSFLDREEAKRHARQQAEQAYEDRYQ
ncbi:CipC protein [Tilletiopsis washingtonensis]|uniref:CipC protein n=1 Tax=Tilletiopsis washingtonensis TaxID=58919 RepID=A0A316Z1L1_9BASI|nr:CipC protein [Tilletiopsis washingtonensis]PWN95421.1 CipC protein [Tilletiopsis washingtonensis]